MKNFLFLLFSALPMVAVSAQASVSLGFHEFLKLTGEQVDLTGKHIIFNFYTDWCEPCKEMDRKVYTDPDVVTYMDENFIIIKVNAETFGRALANEMGIQDFPTLAYFNSKAVELYRVVGFHDSKKLLDVSKRALLSKRAKKKFFKKNYKKYKTNPNFLLEYMEYAKLNEDYNKYDDLAEDYVALEGQLDSLDWMNFVLDNSGKYNSKLFRKLDEHQEDFIRKIGFMDVSWFYARILVNEALVTGGRDGKQSYERKIQSLKEKCKAPENQFAYATSLADLLYNDSYFAGLRSMRDYYGTKLLRDHCGETEEQFVGKIAYDLLMREKTPKASLPILEACIEEKLKENASSSKYDFLSIVLYRQGRKDEAYKSIALANGIAMKNGKKYKSRLKVLLKIRYIK